MGQTLSLSPDACPAGMQPACVINDNKCTAPTGGGPVQHFASVSNNIEGFGESLKMETILLYILIFLIICALACYIKK